LAQERVAPSLPSSPSHLIISDRRSFLMFSNKQPVVIALWSIFASGAHGLRIAEMINHSLEPGCVVFHAQHKSAGNTLVSTLESERLKGYEARSYNVRCDEHQLSIRSLSCIPPKFIQMPYIMTAGYAQTASESGPFGHGKCVWLTMFREPVSRLVSAFYYCKRIGADPLCASNRLDAKKATIEQWADHWGNFLFRELLLGGPLRGEAMPNGTSAQCNALCDAQSQNPQDHAWYIWKTALGEGQMLESEAGKRNMRLVTKFLRGDGVPPLYDAVGVTTQWAKSMQLFDRTAPLHAKWEELSKHHHTTHNSGLWKEEEENELQVARENTHVLQAIAADLKIYNEIVAPLLDNMIPMSEDQKTLLANLEPDLD